ncbi:MAG: histone protein, partial [candidate division NC10 bacterium]
KTGVYAEAVKPTWFREIAPEGVTTEEETEEEEQELEGVAPAEAEEEPEAAPAEVEGQMVSLDEVEKAGEGKEEE